MRTTLSMLGIAALAAAAVVTARSNSIRVLAVTGLAVLAYTLLKGPPDGPPRAPAG